MAGSKTGRRSGRHAWSSLSDGVAGWRWLSLLTVSVVLVLASGCQQQVVPRYEAAMHLWPHYGGGRARLGSGGDNIAFDKLNLAGVAPAWRLDGHIQYANRLWDASLWDANLSGDEVLTTPTRFGSTTFAESGREYVTSDLRVTTLHGGYSTIFRHASDGWFAMGACIDIMNYRLKLSSARATERLEGTSPVLLLQLEGTIPVREDLEVVLSARGLNIMRLLGSEEDAYQVRGEYVDYRAHVNWYVRENMALRGGWQSLVMEVDIDKRMLRSYSHGLIFGGVLVW